MAVNYQAVGWNRQKRLYDTVLWSGVALYVTLFVVVSFLLRPGITIETALIRGLGTCALLCLHVVLCIGPLARLWPVFLPLLYNRRHLGVTTFLLGLSHAVFSVVQFHTLGDVSPLVSVLSANARLDSVSQFPFQPLGLVGLLILFLMAATSPDFWLANLTAPVWKALHMLVYVAYVFLVAHVSLGALQSERHPGLAIALGAGVLVVTVLHVVAGLRERAKDRNPTGATDGDGFIAVCRVDDIEDNRAFVATVTGERVAVFRYDGKLSCVSNVCQHQNGPLGEGRVVDGFITCPWHGYQYCPDTGASPAPFTERIPTFHLKVADGRVLVHPRPNPAGTRVEPVALGQ